MQRDAAHGHRLRLEIARHLRHRPAAAPRVPPHCSSPRRSRRHPYPAPRESSASRASHPSRPTSSSLGPADKTVCACAGFACVGTRAVRAGHALHLRAAMWQNVSCCRALRSRAGGCLDRRRRTGHMHRDGGLDRRRRRRHGGRRGFQVNLRSSLCRARRRARDSSGALVCGGDGFAPLLRACGSFVLVRHGDARYFGLLVCGFTRRHWNGFHRYNFFLRAIGCHGQRRSRPAWTRRRQSLYDALASAQCLASPLHHRPRRAPESR